MSDNGTATVVENGETRAESLLRKDKTRTRMGKSRCVGESVARALSKIAASTKGIIENTDATIHRHEDNQDKTTQGCTHGHSRGRGNNISALRGVHIDSRAHVVWS